MTFERAGSAELERLKEQKPRKMKIVPVPSGDQDDDWPQLARVDYYLPDLDGREDVQVICTGYDKVKPKRFGKHAKPTLYLYFQITDGAHMEKILWGPYPIPEDARKISPSSTMKGKLSPLMGVLPRPEMIMPIPYVFSNGILVMVIKTKVWKCYTLIRSQVITT